MENASVLCRQPSPYDGSGRKVHAQRKFIPYTTQVAFMKQQGEIAALNRAQEKAEARVSSIHHQLSASEAELSVLEGEMAEVRQTTSWSFPCPVLPWNCLTARPAWTHFRP